MEKNKLASIENNAGAKIEVQTPTQVTSKPKSRLWCCLVPVIIVVLAIAAIAVYQFYPYLNPASYGTPQSPARGYTLPEPSPEALNRTLVCDDFRHFKLNKDKYKPLCLNLYKVTEADINSANSDGVYNVVLVYGQYATFELYLPDKINNVDNIGRNFLRTAKFNDLITIPKMMDYYSLADLSYIPKELSPYPALNYKFADQEKIHELCGGYVAGCAILNFETVIKDVFLGENKDVGNLATNASGDSLEYIIKMPKDCYANETIMHETAHAFLVANKIYISGMNTSGWLEAPSYLNEQLTEIFTNKFLDEVCGSGTIDIEAMKVSDKKTEGDIISFTALFPPPMLHPTSFPKDNQCEQAIMSSYSRYLLKGDFKSQFKNFVTGFRTAMKQNKFEAFDDDKKMATFMLKMLGNNPIEKEFLNSHACGI